jgi:hypothetical protein
MSRIASTSSQQVQARLHEERNETSGTECMEEKASRRASRWSGHQVQDRENATHLGNALVLARQRATVGT